MTSEPVAPFDCSINVNKTDVRPDTTAEFFTSGRIPGIQWKTFRVEVPKSHLEFVCTLSGRQLPGDGALLIGWDGEVQKEFYLSSVPVPLDVFFLDKFKTIIGINSVPASSPTALHSPDRTQYALLASAGAAQDQSVQIGDPIRVVDPDGMILGQADRVETNPTRTHN